MAIYVNEQTKVIVVGLIILISISLMITWIMRQLRPQRGITTTVA